MLKPAFQHPLCNRVPRRGLPRPILATAVALTALAALAPWSAYAADAAGQQAPSLHGLPNYPVPPAQRAQAELVAQTGVPVSELAPNAPSSYTVKRGDTLWAIAGMYLRKPWDWPKLWGMNLQQIRNPHWIFPGQVLYLDISNGRARLSMGKGDQGIPTVKLNPQVESSLLPPEGIPTISPELIAPFLTQPLIVEPDTLEASPRIVALPKGHTMASPGTQVYVRGDVSKATRYQLYRPAKPLVDPATKKIIAYQADYLDNPPPPYPRLSRQLGEEGTALLKVQVGPNGRPLQIKLMSSTGYPRLDEAAETTVAQWRFVAATRNGQSITSWVLVPIKFRILN